MEEIKMEYPEDRFFLYYSPTKEENADELLDNRFFENEYREFYERFSLVPSYVSNDAGYDYIDLYEDEMNLLPWKYSNVFTSDRKDPDHSYSFPPYPPVGECCPDIPDVPVSVKSSDSETCEWEEEASVNPIFGIEASSTSSLNMSENNAMPMIQNDLEEVDILTIDSVDERDNNEQSSIHSPKNRFNLKRKSKKKRKPKRNFSDSTRISKKKNYDNKSISCSLEKLKYCKNLFSYDDIPIMQRERMREENGETFQSLSNQDKKYDLESSVSKETNIMSSSVTIAANVSNGVDLIKKELDNVDVLPFEPFDLIDYVLHNPPKTEDTDLISASFDKENNIKSSSIVLASDTSKEEQLIENELDNVDVMPTESLDPIDDVLDETVISLAKRENAQLISSTSFKTNFSEYKPFDKDISVVNTSSLTNFIEKPKYFDTFKDLFASEEQSDVIEINELDRQISTANVLEFVVSKPELESNSKLSDISSRKDNLSSMVQETSKLLTSEQSVRYKSYQEKENARRKKKSENSHTRQHDPNVLQPAVLSNDDNSQLDRKLKKRKRSHSSSSTSSSKQLTMAEKRKKANESEKNRREDLKFLLEQLRILVPDVCDNPKASTIQILDKATIHVRRIRKQVRKMVKNMQRLENLINESA